MKKILRCIFHIDHVIVSLFTILIIELMVLVALNLEFFSPVVRALESFSMTDIYYHIQNKEDNRIDNNTITLVDMTELQHRYDIAKLINDIKALKPKVLAVDIMFEGHILDFEGDDELQQIYLANDSVNTLWACKLRKFNGEKHTYEDCFHSFFITSTSSQLPTLSLVDNAAVIPQPTSPTQHEGFINLVEDPSKSIKRYAVALPYRDTVAYSLPARVAQIVTNRYYEPKEAHHTINYKPVTFPILKHDEIQNYKELITDHIVLLGTTREERDIYYTPIGQISGLQIMAYTIFSMVTETPLKRAGTWMIILWALIAGYITNLIDYFLTKRLESQRSTFMVFITQSEFYDKIISFFVMMLITGASFEFFVKQNYFVDTVLALSTIVLIEEGRLLYAGILSVLKRKTKWKWIEKSIYADELD